MAEQNTLRLPRVDFCDCRLRPLPLEEQRHAEENMLVNFVAVRQGSATLSSSMLIIVSATISVFEGLWKKMNSFK
jgi:hypothetical protein